jgi:hypothetical protein
MFKNMFVSEVCAVYEVLCLVSDRHYTESSMYKGDVPSIMRVSHMGQRRRAPYNAHLTFN